MFVPETDSDVHVLSDGSRHVPLMRALCRLLLHHVAGAPGDVRSGLAQVREGLSQARLAYPVRLLNSRAGSCSVPQVQLPTHPTLAVPMCCCILRLPRWSFQVLTQAMLLLRSSFSRSGVFCEACGVVALYMHELLNRSARRESARGSKSIWVAANMVFLHVLALLSQSTQPGACMCRCCSVEEAACPFQAACNTCKTAPGRLGPSSYLCCSRLPVHWWLPQSLPQTSPRSPPATRPQSHGNAQPLRATLASEVPR